MPKFRVVEKSFINNRICEEGEIVDYEGKVHDNLEPVKAAKAKADKAADEGEGASGEAAESTPALA